PDLLSLRALELDLDLVASLRLRSPQIRALTLVGARLALRRLADGRIRILGLGALQSDDPRTLELFLRQGRLNLVDSEVALLDDRFPGGLPRLTQVQLGLINQGQNHRLELRARPEPDRPADSTGAGPSDARLQVLAELKGDGLDPSTWGGQVYLNLSGPGALALADLKGLGQAPARARALVLEAWLQLGAGGLKAGLGRIALEGLHLTPPGPSPGPAAGAEGSEPAHSQPAVRELVVERLSALARVAPTTEGWDIGVRDLWLALEGSELEGLDLDLRLSAGGHVDGLKVAADTLDLALVGPLVRLYPGPLPETVQRLDDLAAEGHLRRIGFALERPLDNPPRWRLVAIGNGLGIRQSGRVPGVEGLCLRLRADQEGGDLRLRSEWLQVDLAPLFDRPIYLDRFSGLLTWTLGPAGTLHLSGHELVLDNPDLAGRVRFDLDLPAPGTALSPFLDLRASFHDGDGAAARTYLPVGIMHPRLVRWLEGALVGGRVPQADLILRGPLRDYPFRDHQGRFELLLELEDAGLDYLDGWPAIASATGALRFLNQRMEISVDSARLLDSRLTEGHAVMADLWGPHHLSIQGQVEGPFSDGLRVLAETPLARRLGVLPRILAVGGRSHLDLDLEVPLAKGQPVALAGRLTWPGPADITLVGTPLTLTDLAGELRFTEQSVSAEGIAGRLWGRPLSLDVTTLGAREAAGARTEIRARSRLPVSELARHLPSSLWSVARGDADWDLGVGVGLADLTRDRSTLSWRLRSDLRGLALNLPAPLGKTSSQARALDLAGTLLPGRSMGLGGTVEGAAAGDLSLDLDLALTKGSPRIERGRIVIGAREVPAGVPEGLLMAANLPQLDLPAWADWWSRFRGLRAGLAPGAESGASLLPRPLGVDLGIARLDLGAAALTDAQIRAQPGDPGWRVELESQELAGDLGLPAPGSEAPVAINLAWLDLAALLPPGDGDRPASAPAAGLSRLPPTDLRVEDLRWAGASLGRLAVDLRPEPGGLRVPRIELQGPGDTQVRGDASSVDGPEGGRARLALELESADTAPLMRALGYGSVLSEAPLESKLRLEWPGGLTSFALARSSGTLGLKIGAGRLLEVEPGVGRVLGILNLGALSRRLALDFTDLYQQGFSFEQIQADIQIGGGKAELRRFEIEGPASAIRVSGYTNLRSRTFDQTVTVEPRIGSSVALASALAGGPVVGAAVYLADKVTGGTIDKLGSYSYRVTGPWSDPELTRLGWGPFGEGSQGGGPAGEAGTSAPTWFSLPPSRSGENHFLD
ncbi:MAG: YhdP family protein, partial [Bdellovibrio bacteriovorus]